MVDDQANRPPKETHRTEGDTHAHYDTCSRERARCLLHGSGFGRDQESGSIGSIVRILGRARLCRIRVLLSQPQSENSEEAPPHFGARRVPDHLSRRAP
jgi:hypothetical protein